MTTERRPTLTVREAAELLAVGPQRVYQLVADGHLATVPHLGRTIRIARTELDRFLEAATSAA